MKPLLLISLIFSTLTFSQTQTMPFQNPDRPLPARVNDLLQRLTLEEKISQMRHAAPAIARLGIPAYNWWNEALHGVARAGVATVFPQAIGLGATWDEALMQRVAAVISDEGRAKYHEYLRQGQRGQYQGITFWSPNINIFRDPRWGRGQETYGEDPWLTGRLGVAFVRGLQGDHPTYLKTIATPKHYAVHSGPEPDRHTFDALAGQQDLRGTYLPAFEMCVREGGALSIMCAYNRYEGEPCCSSTWLMADILRREWGFAGYIVSDCGAITDIHAGHRVVADAAAASARAVRAGCDLSCGEEYTALLQAVEKEWISTAEIDTAVARLFTARFRLGMFDPPERVPYAQIPYSVNDAPAHDQLALATARASMVLLKNDPPILPLAKSIRKVAVIGPNADNVEVLLGNYNGLPSHPVTPLQGLRDRLGAGGEVYYAEGAPLCEGFQAVRTVPEAVLWKDKKRRQRGLEAVFYNNLEFRGIPSLVRSDAKIDFVWEENAPAPGIQADSFSVRWRGVLVPRQSGLHQLGAHSDDLFRVYLEDTLLVEGRTRHGASTHVKPVDLKAGKPYHLKVEYVERRWNAAVQLVWQEPEQNLIAQAVQTAAAAQAIILCLGLSPRLEGEEMNVEVPGFSGGDRTSLDLPKPQQELMEKIVALGKPTVLVLLNGSALSVNWAAEHVPAIVEAWYPGQRAGTALADLLFGDYNPAGRLPVTFYKSVDQLPHFDEYAMAGRTYRYFTGEVLFPFGHGLSYTQFEYSDLRCPETIQADEEVSVQVTVRNSGKMAGDEVVQLYVQDVEASVPVPLRALQGFRRIPLEAGEAQTVTFDVTPGQLAVIRDDGIRVVEPGHFKIWAGGKQPGFTASADNPGTQVLEAAFTVLGEAYIVPR